MSGRARADLLLGLFPFHWEVDPGLRVTGAGPALVRLLGRSPVGAALADVIDFPQPGPLGYADMIAAEGRPVTLRCKNEHGVALKGQLVHDADRGAVIFVGWPWITRISELRENGLSFRDFPPHHPLQDVLFVVQVGNGALEDARDLAERLQRRTHALDLRRVLSDTIDVGGIMEALSAVDAIQMLGRYQLLCPIGRGGMAVVWAARSPGSPEIVAVKTMLPSSIGSARLERMFVVEAEIASRIRHPNVCEILDVGEDAGILYLVMEWIDGDPLSVLLDQCGNERVRVPFGVCARIVADAARGLQAAHDLTTDAGDRYGVVHRDVSPQNILLTCDGTVKIVDFGVAKITEPRDPLTETGCIKGKVGYLAPEQVQQRAVDARADVFGLGTVLYELSTGTHPFRRETDLATLLQISSDEPAPRPSGAFPDALVAILDRALRKDPAERYASMRDLAADLDALAASLGEPASAVASFAGRMLRGRRNEHAARVRAATRAADERAESERAASEHTRIERTSA